MRTLIFVVVGLLLATLILRLTPTSYRLLAAITFTLAWLSVSIWNLRLGLSHGYTLAQEMPIHLVLFGIPVALTWGLWWWLRN